jgi:hypothetical protein
MKVTVRSIIFALALTACALQAAKKIQLTGASIVPAAHGEIDVGKDHNGNTEIRMTMQHLARPENLSPPMATYVVWLQEKGASADNRGQLEINNQLEASFRTVTPLKSFDVFVTAEPESTVKTPSGPEVLRANVHRK